MINWKHAKKIRPNDKQTCFITVERGWISQPIIGPIAYDAEGDWFLDLFANPEAGELYTIKDHDFWWCDESEINLPDDKEAEQGFH